MLVPEVVISELCDRAASLGIHLVLVGAAARDLTVHAPTSRQIVRATTDIDVAVAVEGESGFRSFVRGLPSTHGSEHTFTVLGIEVDVVPFGGIERNRRIIFGDDRVLDVNGIAEAARTAVEVIMPGGTVVRVASLEAQCALKILAWRDRHRHGTTKDARDLAQILRAASEGPYEDMTWDDEDALVAVEHDIVLAGAYRAGRLAREPFAPDDAAAVTAVLETTPLRRRLLHDMGGGGLDDELLAAFQAGFHRVP